MMKTQKQLMAHKKKIDALKKKIKGYEKQIDKLDMASTKIYHDYGSFGNDKVQSLIRQQKVIEKVKHRANMELYKLEKSR